MSYFLRIEESCILIHKSGTSKKKSLRISYDFEIDQVQYSKHQQADDKQQFKAILGIKVVNRIPFLITVKQSQSICAFQGSQVYQIKSIDWIPITKDIQKLQQSSTMQQLNNISKIFQQGLHYYSDTYSLHRSFVDNVQESNQSDHSYYDQFVWNDNIMKIDMQSQYMAVLFGDRKGGVENYKKQQEIFGSWCTPVIQGYVNLFETVLPDKVKLSYMLVSRRSNKKAGTRFFSRGIDDQGNVANYAETQQIIQYNDTVMTHVQLRGSVPVFFQQVGVQGINIQLNIQRSKQLSKKPFVRHFNNILARYNRVLCVNLLSEKKKSQLKLSKFYEEMLGATTKTQLSQVRYQYFDFHEECKNNQFQNTQRLIVKIKDSIGKFGFNCYNRHSGKLVQKQSGTMRTNCLDCLDRTNYVQSRIALEVLKEMLKKFTSQPTKKAVTEFQLLTHTQLQFNSQILNNFNLLWAQNGDSVSLHYTGIGSTHTDITKVGKRTLFGTVNHKMRSLMRFYTQFTDVKKHQTINTFLGNKSMLKYNYSNESEKKTKEQNILVISWQFSDPEKALEQFESNPFNSKIYRHLIDSVQEQLGNRYTLIVLFLYIPNELVNWQSGINFELKSLINPFKNTYNQVLDKWSSYVTAELESNKQKFILIDSNEHSSCKMLIFCKKSQLESISNIRKDQVTSSMKTKEVVLLTKFKFRESPLVFQGFNVKNIDSFTDFLQRAHEKGFQQGILGRAKSTSISQQSYRLILGNVGSETKLPQSQYKKLQQQLSQLQQTNNPSQKQPSTASTTSTTSITTLINQGCQNDQMKKLLQSNQLMQQKKIKVLANYNEAPLEFIPANNRILFWNEEGKIVRAKQYKSISQLSYGGDMSFKKKPQKLEKGAICECYPMLGEEKSIQSESSVYLHLSYEIDELST